MREQPVSVLILGILNIGFGLLELVMMALSKMLDGFLAGGSGPAPTPMLAKIQAVANYVSADPTYIGWHRITGVLDFVDIVALLASGIGLLLLQNWSRRVSVGYAVYKTLASLVDLVVVGLVAVRLLHDAHQDFTSTNLILIIGSAVLGTIATLIYPVVLFYLLTRPKVVQAFTPRANA